MARIWPWLLIVLALAPAALVHPAAHPTPPSESGIVNIAVLGEGATLDPASATRTGSRMIADNVFPTLFTVGPNGMLAPGLAVTASVSGNVLTIQLARGHLADGTPVTPSLVARALSQTLWPSTHSLMARRLLGDVQGAAAVMSGARPWVSGFQATGPYQLRIVLTHAVPNWIYRLTNPVLGILPVRDLVDGGGFWTISDLLGSGGWTVAADIPNASMEFRRVDGGTASPLIAVQRYPRWKEAALALLNGQVQAAEVPVGQVPSALNLGLGTRLHFLSNGGRIALVINPGPTAPWAHATGQGLPVTRWVDSAFAGHARPLTAARLPKAVAGPAASGSSPAVKPAVPTPLPLAVDAADPLTMALAQTLERLAPGQYHVTVLSSASWASALAKGSLPAALMIAWPGQPLPAAMANWTVIPVMPDGSFWLLAPNLRHVRVFPGGALDWKSLNGS